MSVIKFVFVSKNEQTTIISNYFVRNIFCLFTGNNDALSLDVSVEEEEDESGDHRDEGHAGSPTRTRR